jgi:hypothetical protein
MARSAKDRKAQAAWDRIEALGGSGVWDADVVTVSLAGTSVSDADLTLFRDFPTVRTLDLSDTKITAAGLAHLEGLAALEELIVVGTKLTKAAIQKFRAAHPTVTVVTEAPQSGAINPFTGKPF